MARTAPYAITLLLLTSIFALAWPPLLSAGQHCGAKGDWRSHLVPDRWPPKGLSTSALPGGKTIRPVPIYKSCIRHDDCYDRAGADRAECDKLFLKDMRAQCDRVYKSLFEIPHRSACRSAARGYYEAVVKFGQPAFAAAQAKHRAQAPKGQAEPGPSMGETTQAASGR